MEHQEGGSRFATGVGGAIMGRGAHVFLIDDPFGSMTEARSDIERKRVHAGTPERSTTAWKRAVRLF